MKNSIVIPLILAVSFTYAQKTDKYIKEKDVTRIIQRLAADDMNGRSATDEKSIFKAAAFIEKEFKSIGLKPLPGTTGFLQEFTKEKMTTAGEVVIDQERIADDHVIVTTEKIQVKITDGLSIKNISVDNSVQNREQFFMEKAFAIARDTVSCLVLVAPEFEKSFKEFKGYFKQRFSSGRKGLKAFVLGKTTATSYSVEAKQKVEKVRMANVVGMIEGKTKKDEMVVFGGHYDHLGIRPKVDNDSIANGADDDASGTTAVIALARYFKKAKMHNRTLVFVAFTAEEIGGFGSRYFSQQLNADNVVAMFNIEMIGKASKWGQNSAFITGFERSNFGEILQKNLAGTPFQFKPDPYPDQNLFYRSDNATLARLGVPAHTISTDQIDIDKLYHTVNDEVESLDMKNITSTIKAIALSSKTIVEGSDTPKRIDKSTVR
ncbi:MAG TPA: M20/M25/M40 family metallo-hydrolase [Cyclobacteriaceae bacterium]|nr:M20/M25/M40 family metallo-hydrolase [Cyclobacteriaceae bacterium]